MFKILLFFVLVFAGSKVASGQKKNEGADSLSRLKQKKEIIFINISPGDSILDVGTGAGANLIPIANAYPDFHFTLEDIDSTNCNKTIISKQIAKSGNKIAMENFSFRYGNEKSTMLPDSGFKKIFIFDVLHEITYKTEMLGDIKRILQKDGLIYIEEILVHKTIKKEKACNYPYLTETSFKKILEENNYLIKREATVFDDGHNKYIKIFECVR